ncbi:MAG: hypothetical protein GX967_01785 [Clostridiales bacterium]|nr:hypothetical protein [Clostridiales bacterium]
MSYKKTKYYLGTNSPNGYITKFNELIESNKYHCYILKGMPGIESRAVLEHISRRYQHRESGIEYYYCCNSEDKLDAILMEDSKIIVVDGTMPHIFETSIPGIFHSEISLVDCYDTSALMAHKDDIVNCFLESRCAEKRCQRFLSACSILANDTYTIASENVNLSKAQGFINRLCRKILPRGKRRSGKEHYRQLSAITPHGYCNLLDDNLEEYDTIYQLNCDNFVIPDLLLKGIAALTLKSGLDIIISDNPIFGTNIKEHILVPGIKTAFVTAHFMNGINYDEAIQINCKRFYDMTELAKKRKRLSFNKKAINQLYDEAVKSLASSQAHYDRLSEYYSPIINDKKLDEKLMWLNEQIEHIIMRADSMGT